MKKIFIIIAVIGLVIGFFYAKNWWNEQQALKARQASEIIRLSGVVQEDSLTKSSMALTITESELEIVEQSENIKDLRDKYNTTLDSYIHLKTRLDSLSADRDTTVVEVDSTDSNSVSFRETFGDGWFEVYGKISRDPLLLYGLSLKQIQDILFEVTLEKLPGNEEYVSFVHTNVPFINFTSTPVKVLDKRRWIDRVSIMPFVSLGKFGAGGALFYDEFGAGYTQFTDGSAISF
jgi:hypothetical protein